MGPRTGTLKRTRERYKDVLRMLEEGYEEAESREAYETAFERHLNAVRRMRNRKALSRLDFSINSVLAARKEALDRVIAPKFARKP